MFLEIYMLPLPRPVQRSLELRLWSDYNVNHKKKAKYKGTIVDNYCSKIEHATLKKNLWKPVNVKLFYIYLILSSWEFLLQMILRVSSSIYNKAWACTHAIATIFRKGIWRTEPIWGDQWWSSKPTGKLKTDKYQVLMACTQEFTGNSNVKWHLLSLHVHPNWLPISFWIQFKLLVLTFKTLNGLGPS